MKFNFGNELPKHINPDRVEFDQVGNKVVETVTENPPVSELIPAWTESFPISPSTRWQYFGSDKEGKIRGLKGAALASLAATALLNVGEEHHEGGTGVMTESAAEIFGGATGEELLNKTQEEVCSLLDADFMHRFTTQDENGNEQFNAGAFVVPFAVSLTESCNTKIDAQLNIPYDLARTFTEISVTNPDAREELINRLARLIQEQVQDQLVIRGVAGVTDTLMVWNKKENVFYQGRPRVDLSGLDVSDLIVTGTASAEAERSERNTGPESLTEENRENYILSLDRKDELMPLLLPALERAGLDPSVMENITQLGIERNLLDSQVEELAEMSRSILGETLPGTDSDLERAYELVQEYNDGNPVVINSIEQKPAYAEALTKMLDNNRGVEVQLIANANTEKETVYPISLVLPLLLLALGSVRRQRIPGGTRTINHRQRIVERAVPDTVVREQVGVYEAKRRLFSETTPTELNQKRSFDEVYDSIEVPYEDRQAMIDHLLIEEVLPSLNPESKEPYIDYEAIVNKNREFLSSDARKDGIEKGSYDTTAEAERKIAGDIVEMWERHDAELYPMEGIDVKTVLNYRHSEQVVGWAKLVAPLFVQLMKETITSDQFREELQKAIEDTLEASSHSNRNVFVQSRL